MAEYFVRIARNLPGTGLPMDTQEVVLDAASPAEALEEAIQSQREITGETFIGLSVYLKVWSWYDYD